MISRLVKYTPKSLKPPLNLVYKSYMDSPIPWWVQSLSYKPGSKDSVREYWRNPTPGNQPQEYLEDYPKSTFLGELVIPLKPKAVLEIGCNSGRNLYYLNSLGFKNLEGIEINTEACNIIKSKTLDIVVRNSPVEDVIYDYPDNKFDLVFTMAVLQHIPVESQHIFPEIVRVTSKYLLTIEDERFHSNRHFPRNYQKVFESLGMQQVKLVKPKPGTLLDGLYARLFTKCE